MISNIIYEIFLNIHMLHLIHQKVCLVCRGKRIIQSVTDSAVILEEAVFLCIKIQFFECRFT